LRRLLTAYIQLNRTERLGFVLFTALILLLLSLRLSMRLWISPNVDPEREAALAAAWNACCSRDDPETGRGRHLTAAIGGAGDETAGMREQEKDLGTPRPAVLFPFDPNTLDSTGFRRLGLTERTTRQLLHWRRKGKLFYKKEDLKPLYTLTEAEYKRLEPYIRIAEGPSDLSREKSDRKRASRATVELNTADSATLVQLRGIGPALARRIIRRREALGGFIDHEQLREIHRFPDSTMQLLREQLSIHLRHLVRIHINQVSAEELARHPYVGKELADAIVRLRDELLRFDSVGQLRQLPLMNGENYRKIAPYFTVE
jgi:competence protein ComEA